MTMTTKPRAALYLRQSVDNEMAIDRQRKACRKVARDRGWAVTQEYADNAQSAGKKRGLAVRPAYQQLEADYRVGKFDAIVCMDLDRLTRHPRQIEDWIDAAEVGGLLLTTVDGQADLTTDNGRLYARVKAAVARSEIERKSKRQRDANDQKAERGTPHAGRRCYGYRQDGVTVVKAEAKEIRRAVEMVLGGSSLYAVVADFKARGVVTTAGNPWKRTELRRLMINPRLAGLRVHRGEVVGEGSWKPIIDVDTHRAVVAILADPARRAPGRPATYLLSGVARCGVCGERIYGRQERRGTIYTCQGSPHLGRKAEPVDHFVSKVVVERLALPDAQDLFVEDTSGRLATLQSEHQTLTARLTGLSEAFADGTIDRAQLTAGTARIRARLTTVEAELPSLVVAPAAGPLVGVDDVAAAWEALPTKDQRAIIGALLEVTIFPPGRGARSFDPETVRLRWKT